MLFQYIYQSLSSRFCLGCWCQIFPAYQPLECFFQIVVCTYSNIELSPICFLILIQRLCISVWYFPWHFFQFLFFPKVQLESRSLLIRCLSHSAKIHLKVYNILKITDFEKKIVGNLFTASLNDVQYHT